MIYLNNAATSWPKAPEVVEAMSVALVEPPVEPHRGGHEGEGIAERCRQRAARLWRVEDPNRIVFSSGATESLNLALEGRALDDKHVITSAAEHNSLLRPIWKLADRRGTSVTVLPTDTFGGVCPGRLAEAIRPDTALVCLSHISNVTGWVQPIEDCYAVCESAGIPLLVDAAQSAGCVELDLARMPLAIWVFTGHKGLGGPPGTGGMVLGEGMELLPTKVGGTGIHSLSREMPSALPLRLEPGTPNAPGLAGLLAALDLFEDGVALARARKREELCAQVTRAVADEPRCRVQGDPSRRNPAGIISMTIDGWSPGELSQILRDVYGIVVRSGLHCAPLIHRHLDATGDGTLRISVGHETKSDDIRVLTAALKDVIDSGAGS